MSGNFVGVKVDTKEVQAALSGTGKSLKSIQKGVLRVVAKSSLKAVRNALRSSGLNLSHTGELKSAFRYKIKRDGSEANVFPAGKGGKAIFGKVMALSYGREGTAMRPRAFVQAGLADAEADHSREIQELIEKELSKYWG